jgi:hypothetical protein
MLTEAILAVALGLAPMKAGQQLQVIQYTPGDYAGMIGRYSQSIDSRGITHLSGFDRLTGKPFDLTIAQNGRVEGNVGDMYITFTVSEGA